MAKKQLTNYSLLIIGFLLCLPFLLLYSIHLKQKPEIKEQVLGQSSDNLLGQEKDFWKNYLQQYPDYFPGWLELAKIKIEQNDIEGSRSALKKAQKLNPNSLELQQLLPLPR